MTAHEIYAYIYKEEVQNVCVSYNYEEANRVARAVYGDAAFAIYCNQYPCEIGDKYIDGIFYKSDGITPIEYIPTQEQQVMQLQAENKRLEQVNQELTVAIAGLIGGETNAE